MIIMNRRVRVRLRDNWGGIAMFRTLTIVCDNEGRETYFDWWLLLVATSSEVLRGLRWRNECKFIWKVVQIINLEQH